MFSFERRDADVVVRVRRSFCQQRLTRMLGAQLTTGRVGEVHIELPFQDELTQQHGYLHAAAVTAIADSACGYTALTLTEADREVLSVEFNTNLLSAAAGEHFVPERRVVRPGRRLTVCTAGVIAHQGDATERIARMQATVITVETDRTTHSGS